MYAIYVNKKKEKINMTIKKHKEVRKDGHENKINGWLKRKKKTGYIVFFIYIGTYISNKHIAK